MGPPAGKTGGLILYQFKAIRTEEEKVYLRFDSLILLVLRRKRMPKSVSEIVQKNVQKIKPVMKSPSNKPVQMCPQASQAEGRGFESLLPLLLTVSYNKCGYLFFFLFPLFLRF